MSNPESMSFSAEEHFKNSEWAEDDADIKTEESPASPESEKSEPSRAERIRSEMSLEDINQLDFTGLSPDERAAIEERVKQYREKGDAGPIVDSSAEATNETETSTETEHQQKIQELQKKAVGNIAFKSAIDSFIKDIKEVLNTPQRIIAALGLTAILASGALYAGGKIFSSRSEADGSDKKVEQQIDEEFESLTGYDKLDKRIDGSFEQDGNLGCYESEGKVSDDSVANPDLVLQEMGIDPAKATPEQRGVASEYITYSMKYPTAFQSIAYELDGFKGLSLNEAEDKIANMSDEEKENLQKQIQEMYENSEYSEEVGQGMYRNHGVTGEAGDRHSYFVESDLTGKNILVRETKLADGTTVITREKEDCANMLTEIEYRHPDGTTTVITINTPDEKPGKGDNPDTPPEGHQPKNLEAERKNAGPRVDQQNLNESVTPKTSLAQDQAPVEQAHEQVSSGNIAGSEAERAQQSAVDNSAQTQQYNQEAISHADDTASERANAYQNGDY